MASYLAELTFRLAGGAAALAEGLRHRQAAYLAATQKPDGGFAGRQGPSDLYYTSFALRGLGLLGRLDAAVAEPARGFLQERLNAREHLPGIELLSLVQSAVLLEAAGGVDVFAEVGLDRAAAVATLLDRFGRDDGGYAKLVGGVVSSTYHTFLAVACRQLVGAPLGERGPLIEFFRSRRREDGGFVEIPPIRQSGTNPTAAAVAGLGLLDAMDEPTRRGAIGFLAGMRTTEGGLRASRRVPVADLLSTFSGLVALQGLGGLDEIDGPAAAAYAQALELPTGGFCGGIWDDAADVEYTFYGVGTLSLLAS